MATATTWSEAVKRYRPASAKWASRARIASRLICCRIEGRRGCFGSTRDLQQRRRPPYHWLRDRDCGPGPNGDAAEKAAATGLCFTSDRRRLLDSGRLGGTAAHVELLDELGARRRPRQRTPSSSTRRVGATNASPSIQMERQGVGHAPAFRASPIRPRCLGAREARRSTPRPSRSYWGTDLTFGAQASYRAHRGVHGKAELLSESDRTG